MSDFHVEPSALRGMAHSMRDVAFDVVYPWQYADRHLALSGSGYLFGLAVELNAQVVSKLDETFRTLMGTTSQAHDNLDAAAHYYETTDSAVEARVDRVRISVDDLDTRYPASRYPDAPGSPVDTVPEED